MRLGTIADGVRVLVLGEAGVGKTCFADMFLKGEHFIYHDPFDELRRVLVVNHQKWPLQPVDMSSTTLRDSDPTLDKAVLDSSIANCQGIVLLYNLTSRESFDLVTQDAYMHVLRLRQSTSTHNPNWGKRCGFLLVGNKLDLVSEIPEKRQVEREMAEEWAQSQGFRHIELSSKDRHTVDKAMATLVNSIQVSRRRDKRDRQADKREGWSDSDRPSLKSRIKTTSWNKSR